MTVREFLDTLDTMNRQDRAVWFSRMYSLLSPVSQKTISLVKPSGSLEQFHATLNKEMRKCITIELSEVGADVREVFELPPLTEETNLEI